MENDRAQKPGRTRASPLKSREFNRHELDLARCLRFCSVATAVTTSGLLSNTEVPEEKRTTVRIGQRRVGWSVIGK